MNQRHIITGMVIASYLESIMNHNMLIENMKSPDSCEKDYTAFVLGFTFNQIM